MPKYEVVLKQSEIYIVTVVADDEEEAKELAWDKLSSDDNNKYDYHHDSVGETMMVEEIN